MSDTPDTHDTSAPAIDTPPTPSTQPSTVFIRPWIDPVVDDDGFDPRSRYVELFWLGVLGPTATWLIRRLAAGLEQHPEGYELDLAVTARAMGMSYVADRPSPFGRAVQRCHMFGVAHRRTDGIAVRRRIPALSARHLRRMPDELQAMHADWIRTTIHVDELTRAHSLAATMFDLGDDPSVVEHQLVALGVRDAVASETVDNAVRLRRAG